MIPLALLQAVAGGGLVINAPTVDLNLKEYYEARFAPAVSGDSVSFTLLIPPTSSGATTPALRTGVWASGVDLNIDIRGLEIPGAGGYAGGTNNNGNGQKGGVAFLVESFANIQALGAELRGGGGGGGWAHGPDPAWPKAGGGGGAGKVGGLLGTSNGYGSGPGDARLSTSGTADAGGLGAIVYRFYTQPSPGYRRLSAGSGGGPGLPGFRGSDSGVFGFYGGLGGDAGESIVGLDFVTWLDQAPTLVGPTVA